MSRTSNSPLWAFITVKDLLSASGQILVATNSGNQMAKMTNATTWSRVGPDDGTGSLIDLNYTCPHCDYPTGELIFVGSGNDLDSGWETDQVCGVCDKPVTVMVRVPAS